MRTLRYTLLADGPSDRCLAPLVDRALDDLLSRAGSELSYVSQVADLRLLREPTRDLSERMRQAHRQFPCDLLLVHRDAESGPGEARYEEIDLAAREASLPPHVAIVPVRMTEAWLLLDQQAIRRAADNPQGTMPIPLPPARSLDALPDPKARLDECLDLASGKRGRHLDRFRRRRAERVVRVANLIGDLSALRRLTAFQRFESDIEAAVLGFSAPDA